jgi:hypothetical protein
MTKPTGLPDALRAKLTALTRHIRLLRATRGLCLLTMTLVLLLGGLCLADTLLTLPREVLRWTLLGIAGVAALVAVCGLLLPLLRRHDPEALAALIEERYPELGERLTTTVELAGNRDAWHGSLALIELLSADTERRAHPLDFTRAFPARSTGWLALVTLAALLLAAAPAFLWGDAYTNFGSRLLAAWLSREPELPAIYTFHVFPNGGYAAKGRPLSLLVMVHADHHRDLAPPAAATLVYTAAQNKLVRVRMSADATVLPGLAAGSVAQAASPLGALQLPAAVNLLSRAGPKTRVFTYHFDRLDGDLSFHVKAGRSESGACHITAVEPVELHAESPQVTVSAPPYANAEVHPQQTVPPLTAELSVFEFGEVRFDCRFTRPAVAARLEVSRHRDADGAARPGGSWVLPLALEGDRTRAVFAVPSLGQGAYDLRLTLEAGHGITTAHELRTLTVRADEPPVFVTKPEVAGLRPTEARPDWQIGADPTGANFSAVRGGFAGEHARDVAPTDTLKLKLSAADTLGVDRVELEYRVNDGPPQFETVAEGKGRLKAEPPQGEHAFKLSGKVKEGDVVLFRLRASDNRRVGKGQFRDAAGRAVPRAELKPHVTYYPERARGKDRWFLLRVSHKAEPLARQEILAQRDQVRQKIDAIQKKLNAERGQLNKFRAEARTRPQLSPEQQSGLRELRHDNRGIRNDLHDLARDTQEAPALQSLSDTAEQLARNELTRSEQALTKAHDGKQDAGQRDEQLRKADAELARAQKQLDQLRQQTEKLAQARLDQLKLEQLARRQQELGKRAEDLAGKDQKQDPQARAELDRLRAEQNEVAEELRRLADQSELLREALKAAQADQAKDLAEKAKELAQAQRDLTEAARETTAKEAAAPFGELARKQHELAQKAAELARATARPARAANKQPLRPEDAQKAAEALKQGDVGEALQKQDQAARELDRLARDFDAALNLARDPREAARQLANLQDDLRKRVAEEVKKKDKVPVAERLKTFRPEQEALQRAATALEVPPAYKEARDSQKQAGERMKNAAQGLQQNNPSWADSSMKETRQALQRLAERLPTADQRKQQALAQLGDIKRQQQDVARQAEQAVKQAEKKDPADPKNRTGLARALANAARQQAQLAERVGKLDVPTPAAARQEKAEKALSRALNDLLDAQPRDVPASQQAARRELDRLEKALRGEQVVDDKAGELARNQKEPGAEAPRQLAQKLAQEQRQLAQATQRAQGKPGLQGKQALEKLAQQQGQLNQKARQLDASKAQTGLQKARQAMNRAQEELQKNNPAEARRKQQDAAQALEQLARQLPAKVPAPAAAKEPTNAAQGLPTKAQANQARQLAEAQKELRDAVQKMAAQAGLMRKTQPSEENPLGELARKQRDIARQAAELAKDVAKEQGQKALVAQQARQAARQAQQAAQKANTGQTAQAQKAGQQLAQDLRKLAQDLNQTPRGNADLKAPDPAQRAVQLAQQQEELNRKMQALASNQAAQQAQQAARQGELQQQAKELTQQLGKLGQNTPTGLAKQAAQQATQAANQAQQAMQQAQNQAKQGNPGKAAQAGQQAAQQLDQAAQKAAQAAQQMQVGQQPAQQTAREAGQALQQGKDQIGQAQAKLGQGLPRQAQGAMQKAAQSLQQAAAKASQQLERSKESGPPNQFAKESGLKGAAPVGLPDLSAFGKELKQYAGRSWGELPGELRTRITQAMQARYGEDYAGIIQRYFEQIADTNRAKKR